MSLRNILYVIASAAKQSFHRQIILDCFANARNDREEATR